MKTPRYFRIGVGVGFVFGVLMSLASFSEVNNGVLSESISLLLAPPYLTILHFNLSNSWIVVALITYYSLIGFMFTCIFSFQKKLWVILLFLLILLLLAFHWKSNNQINNYSRTMSSVFDTTIENN